MNPIQMLTTSNVQIFLFSKLNTYTRDYIHEQLAKKDKTLAESDIEEFYDLAVKSEKKKHNDRSNTSAHTTPYSNRQNQRDH